MHNIYNIIYKFDYIYSCCQIPTKKSEQEIRDEEEEELQLAMALSLSQEEATRDVRLNIWLEVWTILLLS